MTIDYEQLSAYLDDELNADERSALEARLQADAELQAELASLRQTVELVRGMPMLKAPRSYTLDPARYGKPRRVLAFPRVRVLAPTLAAVLVVMIAGVVLLSHSLGNESVSKSESVALDREAATAPAQQEVAIAATATALPSASPTPLPTVAAAFSALLPAPTLLAATHTQDLDLAAQSAPETASGALGAASAEGQTQAESEAPLPPSELNEEANITDDAALAAPAPAQQAQPAAADEVGRQDEARTADVTVFSLLDEWVRRLFALFQRIP